MTAITTPHQLYTCCPDFTGMMRLWVAEVCCPVPIIDFLLELDLPVAANFCQWVLDPLEMRYSWRWKKLSQPFPTPSIDGQSYWHLSSESKYLYHPHDLPKWRMKTKWTDYFDTPEEAFLWAMDNWMLT